MSANPDPNVVWYKTQRVTFLDNIVANININATYNGDGRGFLLSDAITVPNRTALAHQTQYYLDLLRPLGVPSAPTAPRLFVSDAEEQTMRERFAENGIQATDSLIGINPGSTYGGAKRWLPERFAEASDRMVEQFGGRAVIVGAVGEEALGHAIAEKMRRKPVVLSGRTSIRELMAIIKRRVRRAGRRDLWAHGFPDDVTLW